MKSHNGRLYDIAAGLILICTFGLIMIYSVSAFTCGNSEEYGYDSAYFLKRQMFFMLLGFVGILILLIAGYRFIYRYTRLIYILSILCIVLLYTPLGVTANGARRWLRLGLVSFQVAEMVKLSVILILGYLIRRYRRSLRHPVMTIYLWFAGGIPAAMILFISNDLSSALVILGITFMVTFIFTDTYKLHSIVLLFVLILTSVYVFSILLDMPTQEELDLLPFRVGRIAAWIDPDRYASGTGYQILQALYAIGSGGVLGKGLGNSIQKLGRIPEGQNDMIFSIICEELGLFGAFILIGLLFFLLTQIWLVIMDTENIYEKVVVSGIFLHIFIQSFINLCVNVNLFPNTGLPLPFISYGGSSIAILMVEMGVVMAIDLSNSKRKMKL